VPNTIDPPSGKFGITVHPDDAQHGQDPTVVGNRIPDAANSVPDTSNSAADHHDHPEFNDGQETPVQDQFEPFPTPEPESPSNSEPSNATPESSESNLPPETTTCIPENNSVCDPHGPEGMMEAVIRNDDGSLEHMGGEYSNCPTAGGGLEPGGCTQPVPDESNEGDTKVEVIAPAVGDFNVSDNSNGVIACNHSPKTENDDEDKTKTTTHDDSQTGGNDKTDNNYEPVDTSDHNDFIGYQVEGGDGTNTTNPIQVPHFGSDSGFVPVISHSSDDAIGTPAGAPIHFGDSSDPNANPEELDLAAVLAAHPKGGTDPTVTDPAEEQGEVHSALGVTVSNVIRPGMDGSSHDGLWGNPEDPRNYLGDDQFNPPDPSTYGDGDGGTSQAQGQSQLQSPQSMGSPTSSGEGIGAGPSGAFWEQADGASGSSPSGTGPGMEFGATSDHGPGSGGQGAGQFSPSGNHSEVDQSNSGTQFDVASLAHHADASVVHMQINTPDNSSEGNPGIPGLPREGIPQDGPGSSDPQYGPDPGGTPSAHYADPSVANHADASLVHLDISPLPNFADHMHI
jgi:hypothetical protein